jgi:hypothetical protein
MTKGIDRDPMHMRCYWPPAKVLSWIARATHLVVASSMLLVMAVAMPAALAHGGGTPQLVEEPAGTYEIFTWTNPEPARVGTFHVTVALVEPATDQPVLNAGVLIHAAPAGTDTATQPILAPATHEKATIKTYYEADLELPTAGPWQITVAYTGTNGIDAGNASFPLEVQEPGINWGRIALGIVLVILAGSILLFNRIGGRWLRK